MIRNIANKAVVVMVCRLYSHALPLFSGATFFRSVVGGSGGGGGTASFCIVGNCMLQTQVAAYLRKWRRPIHQTLMHHSVMLI